MMLFSIGTRLVRVGIVGLELELPLGLMLRSPTKTSSKEDRRGTRSWTLQCLSQFFPDERKDQLLRGRMFGIPFTDGVA